MLKTIISKITSELKNAGVADVYTAFDCIPIDKKGNICTIVGIENFKSTVPIFSYASVYMPFKAEASLSLIASPDMSLINLCDYFDSKIMPAIRKIINLNLSLGDFTIKNDSGINRLVMKISLSVSGVSRLERSIS